ncbi:hypothetical protein V6N13_042064 [Hibiscus sabdariffa]
MGAGVSGLAAADSQFKTGLNDVPEGCISSIYMYLDPPEICKLARLNKAFRRASLADFVWETKLPSNYRYLVKEVLGQSPESLSKKETFARLCRPIRFGGGTKEVWLDKSSGKLCLSVSAKALKITGIDDRRYWNQIPTEESRFEIVAYLQQIWWFEVVGELEFEFPPGSYSVFFRLHLGKPSRRFGRRVCNVDQVHGWNMKPVRFQLSTSTGQEAASECCLYEPGNWVHYHAGDFVVDDSVSPTKIKFSMMQIDCTHTKGGLCVDSVLIYPSEFRQMRFNFTWTAIQKRALFNPLSLPLDLSPVSPRKKGVGEACKGSKMDDCSDFIQLLGPDVSMKILMNLVNPCDLIRVCLVSSSWRQFVIETGLFKQLCLKLFPEISGVTHTIEANDLIYPVEFEERNHSSSECHKRNHRVYAFLSRALNLFIRKDCISEAIVASSTDNYPEESIHNTLEPLDRIEHRASYWSSKGQSDPSIPETLLYKLMAKMCLVTEIHVQPFQAYFQYGFPIYSSKAVRFRMGHLKVPEELQSETADGSTSGHKLADNKFIWTYVSPEFPMAQENCLQKFKLPEPVLCIGGILQIELLGRLQRQEMDGLFYICISHVQVVGRPLLPGFDIEMIGSTGRCALKYLPETEKCMLSSASPVRENGASSSRFRTFTTRLIQRGTRGWEQVILSALLHSRAGGGANDADDVPPASP